MITTTSPAVKPVTIYESQTIPVDAGAEREASVLIVDDDRTMRRMASGILKNHCHVYEASDATEALNEFYNLKPNIVFMDINLPDGCGYDLLYWIMRSDPTAYVVMLSGFNYGENIIKSVGMGARDFISKPLDAQRILFHLKKFPKFS